jgi:hypothetical protein
MKAKGLLITLISGIIMFSVGCSSDRLNSSAEQAKKEAQEEKKKNKDLTYEEQIKEWQKKYEKQAVDVDKVLKENPYKEVRKYGKLEFEVRESYENPQEFANFAAQTLYKFYRGEISPDAYLNFVYDYGSTFMKRNIGTGNIEDDVEVVKSLQKQIAPTARDYADYELSEVITSEEDPNIAYVYRKLYTVTGAEKYFQITLPKSKDNTWLLADEQASAPIKFK